MLYWIWLTQIKGVGPKRQRLLLEKFNTPENIYRASFKELLQCPGIGNSKYLNLALTYQLIRTPQYIFNNTLSSKQ